jgi:hypothetical protein
MGLNQHAIKQMDALKELIDDGKIEIIQINFDQTERLTITFMDKDEYVKRHTWDDAEKKSLWDIEVEKTAKYKVGDPVKLLTNQDSYEGFYEAGDVVEIYNYRKLSIKKPIEYLVVDPTERPFLWVEEKYLERFPKTITSEEVAK